MRWSKWPVSMHYLAIIVAMFVWSGAASAGETLKVGFWPLTIVEEQTITLRQPVVRVEPSGDSEEILHAAIDIEAPAARVWQVMLDCARATKFVEGLTHCDVLEVDADGKGDVRRHLIRWAWFLPEVESVFRSTYVREQQISFEKISGSFSKLKGSWTLQPLAASKTRVRYESRIGLPLLVPEAMVQAALESDLSRTLRALRDEFEGSR